MTLPRIALASCLAFGLDRLSKVAVIDWLGLPAAQKIAVWPPYFNLAMAWNRGVNFGFLHSVDARWLLVGLSIAASLALAFWARAKPGWAIAAACGAVIGGALGNAYDRVAYGAVADYLNMSCCSIQNPYSFNVADVLIFGGAIALVFAHEADKKGRT